MCEKGRVTGRRGSFDACNGRFGQRSSTVASSRYRTSGRRVSMSSTPSRSGSSDCPECAHVRFCTYRMAAPLRQSHSDALTVPVGEDDAAVQSLQSRQRVALRRRRWSSRRWRRRIVFGFGYRIDGRGRTCLVDRRRRVDRRDDRDRHRVHSDCFIVHYKHLLRLIEWRRRRTDWSYGWRRDCRLRNPNATQRRRHPRSLESWRCMARDGLLAATGVWAISDVWRISDSLGETLRKDSLPLSMIWSTPVGRQTHDDAWPCP